MKSSVGGSPDPFIEATRITPDGPNLRKRPGTDNVTESHDGGFFENRRFLTVKEAAAYLGTTPHGIRMRIYRKQLVPLKPFGPRGSSFISLVDLVAHFEASRKRG
jgi:hypothetical protein